MLIVVCPICLRTPMRRIRSFACLLLLVTGAATLNLHCASTSPPADADAAETAPQRPAYTLLVHHADSLRLHDLVPRAASEEAGPALRATSPRLLRTGVASVQQHVPAPARNAVAVTYTTPDSVHLARYTHGAPGIQPVDARARPATYSVAWHPERDLLAYGVYTPTAEGNRGPGTIRIAEGGTTRSVGCSASSEVLAWTADAQLSVRNDDTLYLVSSRDCATQARLDVRRHHHMTYDASGAYLAYIYRELEYNRDADAYQPDSSLYVSNAAGANETRLFGDARAPRQAAWAPETPELAVSVSEDNARRLVLYNAAEERTTFLIPPATAPEGAQRHPRWAPDNSTVAFTLAADTVNAAVYQANATTVLRRVTGPAWGWIDAQTLVLPTQDGLALVRPDDRLLYTLPPETALIGGWPAPPVQ